MSLFISIPDQDQQKRIQERMLALCNEIMSLADVMPNTSIGVIITAKDGNFRQYSSTDTILASDAPMNETLHEMSRMNMFEKKMKPMLTNQFGTLDVHEHEEFVKASLALELGRIYKICGKYEAAQSICFYKLPLSEMCRQLSEYDTRNYAVDPYILRLMLVIEKAAKSTAMIEEDVVLSQPSSPPSSNITTRRIRQSWNNDGPSRLIRELMGEVDKRRKTSTSRIRKRTITGKFLSEKVVMVPMNSEVNMAKISAAAPDKIHIQQIHPVTGQVLRIHRSSKDAANFMKINHSSGGISKCCNGKAKRCGGFQWRFYSGPSVDFDAIENEQMSLLDLTKIIANNYSDDSEDGGFGGEGGTHYEEASLSDGEQGAVAAAKSGMLGILFSLALCRQLFVDSAGSLTDSSRYSIPVNKY